MSACGKPVNFVFLVGDYFVKSDHLNAKQRAARIADNAQANAELVEHVFIFTNIGYDRDCSIPSEDRTVSDLREFFGQTKKSAENRI